MNEWVSVCVSGLDRIDWQSQLWNSSERYNRVLNKYNVTLGTEANGQQKITTTTTITIGTPKVKVEMHTRLNQHTHNRQT